MLSEKKKIIFKKCGNFIDSLNRYLVCSLMAIKYDLEYSIENEYPTIEEYKFYKGVDHTNDDIHQIVTNNINELKNYVNNNINAKGFNTLGFVKGKIDINNLSSNYYINEGNEHGIFVKNIININSNNFNDYYNTDLSNYNIRINGNFNILNEILNSKDIILNYIEQNKNNHDFFNFELNSDKIYDIVIHLDSEKLIDLEYLNKIFNENDFSNKKCAIVCDKSVPISEYIEWFKNKNIIVNIESNYLSINFNIIRQCKILISSNSKLAHCTSYLSTNNQISYVQSNKAYICGCVKNCGAYLEDVFKNIVKIGELFEEFKIVIAYDNSNDNSLNILYKLKEQMHNICDIEIIINKNALSQYRTKNIANSRNSILKYIHDDNTNNNFKYFIMMDMDDVCSKPIKTEILDKYLLRDDWDALSFNRQDYYDIWALSVTPYVISCWHWLQDSKNVTNIMQKYIKNKLDKLDEHELLDCYSAFNGFAIYKIDKFINCNYDNNIFKSLAMFSDEQISNNINILNNILIANNLEDCEHRYFHMNAIQKNNARIRISPLYLFGETESNKMNISMIVKKISSRGILNSCNIKSSKPYSSNNQLLNYNFNEVFEGCTIYICNYAISHFATVMNSIKNKFILVSGDSDCTVPNELFPNNDLFLNFINNSKIIHWYAQNCVLEHPKLSKIPIGLDYHTMSDKNTNWGEQISPNEQENMLNYINNQSKPFFEREIKCYSNFHFCMETKYGFDRKDALKNINPDLIYYEQNKVKREDTWKNQSNYAFVISPHGNGLDCHRTWEALCLGCIPIVKKSGISDLFDELPVLIIDDWKNITNELLIETINKFKDITFNYDKLLLKYWIDKINNK